MTKPSHKETQLKIASFSDDMLKAVHWSSWRARAKLDKAEGMYLDSVFDEAREVEMFEEWYRTLAKSKN